jgi:hypothetical protein
MNVATNRRASLSGSEKHLEPPNTITVDKKPTGTNSRRPSLNTFDALTPKIESSNNNGTIPITAQSGPPPLEPIPAPTTSSQINEGLQHSLQKGYDDNMIKKDVGK